MRLRAVALALPLALAPLHAALSQSSAGSGGGGGGSAGTVSVSNFPATQPVSGTVAATQSGTWATGLTGTLPAFAATPSFNVGTTGGLALDATLTARLAVLGQGTMAASAPVVIASNQSPVSANLYVGGNANAVANPALFGLVQNGGNVTAANPLISQLYQNGSPISATNPLGFTPSATAAVSGPVPAIATGPALLAKSSAGNLYGYSFTQGTTAGFAAILNVSAAPASGAAISPLECVPVAANAYVARRQDVPDRYGTGLAVVMSSSCTTYTPVTPAIMSLLVQ